MTMATVAYKRRLFPVRFLKAHPMARSRVATVTTKFVEIAETERNFGNFSDFSDIFWGYFTHYTHIFLKIHSYLGTIKASSWGRDLRQLAD